MAGKEEIDFGMKMPEKPSAEVTEPKAVGNKENVLFTDEQVKGMIDNAAKQTAEMKSQFCCLVIGADGTGKTGIVMDYCSKLEKKTLIIDLDGGAYPLYGAYHKGNEKIIIIQPFESKMTATGVEFDYKMTISKIRALIKYVKEHRAEYSAIVLDGISSLLKFAEYLMRVDKHIAPDGGVQMRFWLNRNKAFTEVLDSIKNIPDIDIFFVGHEDFIVDDDSAAVKVKTSQMIHQRIICTKVEDEKLGKVMFKAKVDKSKYNLSLEGKEFTFATVEKDKITWNSKPIFEGLKGNDVNEPEKTE